MKQVKSVDQVIREMNATTNYQALGLTPPDHAHVEALVQGMKARIKDIEASLPKPWDEMTNEEQDAWFAQQGIGELTPKETTAQYGDATITFFGQARPPLHRGSIVAVQYPDGSWHNRMVAVGAESSIIYVTGEDEWQQAERESREPLTIAYPAERVKLTSEK